MQSLLKSRTDLIWTHSVTKFCYIAKYFAKTLRNIKGVVVRTNGQWQEIT